MDFQKADVTATIRGVENKIFTIYGLGLLILIYACILITSLFASSGEIQFLEAGTLTLPSWILFICICLIALWRENYYFFFLFFIILAFPAPIDDIFPSIPITNLDDKVQVLFPMITRIDLYLILGIFIYLNKQQWKLKILRLNKGLKILLLIYPLILLAHVWYSADLWDFNIVLAYSFHLRYLLLFLLLAHLTRFSKFQRVILIGIVFSLGFLFLEALINSYFRGSSRLLSGSLSLNTFANISAALAIYLWLIYRKKILPKWICAIGMIIALLIIIGSGTRGAIITLIGTAFLIYMISNKRRILVNSLKVLLGLLILGSVYIYSSTKEWIPERYSYIELSEKVEVNWSRSTFSEMFDIRNSEVTSSIKSRLSLFDSSRNMIQSHPFSGIGPGRWNRYKNTYSLDGNIPKVLLDTHNDYLALGAQYGLLLGAVWAWLVFFYPLKKSLNAPAKRHAWEYLYAINLAMGIAAISNSGLFKHQVAAVLIFSLSLTIVYRKGQIEHA